VYLFAERIIWISANELKNWLVDSSLHYFQPTAHENGSPYFLHHATCYDDFWNGVNGVSADKQFWNTVSLVAAINDHMTEFSFNLSTFLSRVTLLKSWINSTFSNITLMQRFKRGTTGCKYNKSIYLNYIPFREKFYLKYI